MRESSDCAGFNAAAFVFAVHRHITWDPERDDPEEMGLYQRSMVKAREAWPWLDAAADAYEAAGGVVSGDPSYASPRPESREPDDISCADVEAARLALQGHCARMTERYGRAVPLSVARSVVRALAALEQGGDEAAATVMALLSDRAPSGEQGREQS